MLRDFVFMVFVVLLESKISLTLPLHFFRGRVSSTENYSP